MTPPSTDAAPPRRRGGEQQSLTAALSDLLAKQLLPDLATRARESSVRAALSRRWEHEKATSRTGESFDEWTARTLEQIGAAWILSCVFLRTLEDRELLAQRRIAGPGAEDSQQLFHRLAPRLSSRDYLLTAFRETARLPGAEELLGPNHNPAWRLSPSVELTNALLEFFRQKGQGEILRWSFAGTDTRFLGDLYQDLSASVRERYALLQTPQFVEKFILDLTLEPAIATFGLDSVKLIDPTCGSGHFLLGAFDRLFEKRMQRAPALETKEHALAALAQVYGVDLNPYAVAITRFRLVLAFMEKTGIGRLARAPKLHLNLVVADSLLHGAPGEQRRLGELTDDRRDWGDSLFDLEDEGTARTILLTRYHAVVGNPPYITCKDKTLRDYYRELYPHSTTGKYALAAPFIERLFQLGLNESEGAGFVGLINASSFAKARFGRGVVEHVIPSIDLQRVIYTSGIHALGDHGTDTLLLFGRNRLPTTPGVTVVKHRRGDPSGAQVSPKWASIAAHFDDLGFEDEYISVDMASRVVLGRHPWSLGGGGAAELKELLDQRATRTLRQVSDAIGVMVLSGEDEVYFLPSRSETRRLGIDDADTIDAAAGGLVRDWAIRKEVGLRIFGEDGRYRLAPSAERYLWPFRTTLRSGIFFDQRKDARKNWREYASVQQDKFRARVTISFAEISTHNHFALDRTGTAFAQTAPVIKLPAEASDRDHLGLLGLLNSSATCFWLRQCARPKGGSGVGRGVQDEAWEERFAFASTMAGMLPLPQISDEVLDCATALDLAAKERLAITARFVLDSERSKAALVRAAARERDLLGRMVALQERLDFEVYRLFELLDETPSLPDSIAPGHRFFEVQLVRDEAQTAWFERHDYERPSAGEPSLDDLSLPPEVRLMEQPEYKRRWLLRDWDAETREALRSIVAEQIESAVKTANAPASASQIAQRVAAEAANSGLEAVANDYGLDIETLALDAVKADSIPFHSALRFSEVGLEKHVFWKSTWDLQRSEDRGEGVGEVPVPPKYDRKDYRVPTFFGLRGKLDVPKERFISYPSCERDAASGPLIGWAGWDHLQRAQALAALYNERKNVDGWEREQLTPMLAGLLELIPWLLQWHNEPNPEFDGAKPGESYKAFLDAELNTLKLTDDELRKWRPRERGRRRRATATEEPEAEGEQP